jgi:hypothetical protein
MFRARLGLTKGCLAAAAVAADDDDDDYYEQTKYFVAVSVYCTKVIWPLSPRVH